MTSDHPVKIRPAIASDVPTILRFVKELAEFEKLSHAVIATEADLSRTLFEQKTSTEVILAEVGGKPVGFALFFQSYSTFLAKPGIYLEDLYVSPTQRSAGVGAALLKRLAHICLERNYGRLEWSVLDWNERALKFYAKVGAVPMAEWTVQRMDESALREFVARN